VRGWLRWTLLLLIASTALAQDTHDKLWHHRNLGKAFYENPATQYEAIGEFEKALALAPDSVRERINYGLALLRAGQPEEGIAELVKAQKADPSIPHTWFNLGITYKQNSRYEDATVQFEKMVELAPDDPIAHYNLAVLYKLAKRTDDAIRHFERSAALDPNLAGPHFQLSTSYRQAKRPDDAKREMTLFRAIKKQNQGAAVPEDLEWSYYAEIYDEVEPDEARDDAAPASLAFARTALLDDLDAATAGLVVLDFGGDATADLLAFSSSGIHLFAQGKEKTLSGLESLQGVRHIAAADFDNDGFADLAVVTATGATLYRQQEGRFHATPGTFGDGTYNFALWLDYDHDYDSDLFLLGGASRLYRNQGTAGFEDRTADFPFIEGEAVAATSFDLVADTQAVDLAVAYARQPGVIYRDRLAGKYEKLSVPMGRALHALVARDFDNDGWTDLVVATRGNAILMRNDHHEGFREISLPKGGGTPLVFADFESRGLSDLVRDGTLFRNQALSQFAEGVAPTGFTGATALAAADFDGDGKVDLATVSKEGVLAVLSNRTATKNRWLAIVLEGVKNPVLAPGSEVEVKAGRRYQKKIYNGLPLVFGLGSYAEVDTVRITWPNGLIQNETRQATNSQVAFKEAQRLSGSCPMIFTWNGNEFEFITDVLGVAPLGASAGDGEYFPVDHDEVIQIPGSSLVARDGRYDIRITEELREVAFLDDIHLVAVDHPEDVDVYTNDKFKGPPFPEFRLFGVSERLYPRLARDHHGQDVLSRLTQKDRTYPDDFARDYAGVAELHHLDLDFGPAGSGTAGSDDEDVVMVLSGWVDWADGSTFLATAQENPAGLIVPSLQVKDENGAWQTVIDDMGMPAGKPKTIVVDLSGKFLSASREVRIVTNLCVYWDEIFLAEGASSPEVTLRKAYAERAELRFRGFSGVVIHPQRKQPEHFVYAELRPLSMWNPTPGLYTRYGNVGPLLGEVDDRLVVMGSGDELRLSFDAVALGEPPAGWRRDFLLVVDGWAKDGDANTAHSQTVGPLPYHGMPAYPYEAPHHYPDDGVHNLYREHYNIRPGLRLIRPLTEEIAP
jgi:lipoprotein NlpI